jgi:hypothetical protein
MTLPCLPARFASLLLTLPLIAACGSSATSNPGTDTEGSADGDTGAPADIGADIGADTGADTGSDLVINVDVGAACDREDDLAPNQSPDTAATIDPLGYEQNNLYLCAGTTDWFRLTLSPGQQFGLDFGAGATSTGLRARLALASDPGVPVGTATPIEGGTSFSYVADATVDLVLVVEADEGGEGRYTLSASTVCTADSACPEGTVCLLSTGRCEVVTPRSCGLDQWEPNDSSSSATPIELGETGASLDAIKSCVGDPDYFDLTLPTPGTVDVAVSFRSDATLTLRVFDGDGRLLSDEGAAGTGSPAATRLELLPAGRYLLLVEDASATETSTKPYTLDVGWVAESCITDDDCGAVAGRNDCVEGACRSYSPGTPSGPGGLCDDGGDCAGDLGCYVGRTGLADNRCTRECGSVDDCADFEAPQCIRTFGTSICVEACDDDYDCPFSFTCTSSGCQQVRCNLDADCAAGSVCRRSEQRATGTCTSILAPACRSDDRFEPNDTDRQATVALTEAGLADLSICDANDDWFTVSVPGEGEGFEITATSTTVVDLDLFVYTPDGIEVTSGRADAARSDTLSARYIPAGDYLFRVNQYPGDRDVVTRYALTLARFSDRCTVAGEECLSLPDLRPVCDELTGSCGNIDGNGAVELGGRCDSDSDCNGDAELCWTFEPASARRNICTQTCESNADCAAIADTSCVALQSGGAVCLPG